MRGRPAAGLLLVLAGAVVLMGITTAEALYPEAYSTHLNVISDLGAPKAPRTAAFEPSATVFNGAMLLAGTSIVAAAYALSRDPERIAGTRFFVLALALHGLGTFGVGLFPSDQLAVHRAFAALTFAAGGGAALLSACEQRPPSRYASAVLSIVILGALVLTGLGSRTALYEELGAGGIERWIAYPTAIWLAAFGGWLLATSTRHDEREALR